MNSDLTKISTHSELNSTQIQKEFNITPDNIFSETNSKKNLVKSEKNYY